MKKMISLLCSLAIITGAGASLTVSAQNEKDFYSYCELAEMSDEEVFEIIGSSYLDDVFGDDSVSDEVKFKKLFPDFDSVEHDSYSTVKMLAEGISEGVIYFEVDENVPLNHKITAADLGFPADWTVSAFDGTKYIPNLDSDVTEPVHEYRVHVPAEVFADFETFWRMWNSLEFIVKNNVCAITDVLDPIQAYAPRGEYVIIEEEPKLNGKIWDKRDPDSKLSDGVKKAVADNAESVRVYIIYDYNANEFDDEAIKRAEEEYAALDKSQYDEVQLEKIKHPIYSKHLKEVASEYRTAILNDIGADVSDVNLIPWMNCNLSAEQIKKAEAHEKILGIFLCDQNYFLDDPLIRSDASIETPPAEDDSEEQKTPVGTVSLLFNSSDDTNSLDSKMIYKDGQFDMTWNVADSGINEANNITLSIENIHPNPLGIKDELEFKIDEIWVDGEKLDVTLHGEPRYAIMTDSIYTSDEIVGYIYPLKQTYINNSDASFNDLGTSIDDEIRIVFTMNGLIDPDTYRDEHPGRPPMPAPPSVSSTTTTITTEAAATTTTTAAKTTAAVKTTSKKSANTPPKTGDAGIAGILLAGAGAAATAFVLRKREN